MAIWYFELVSQKTRQNGRKEKETFFFSIEKLYQNIFLGWKDRYRPNIMHFFLLFFLSFVVNMKFRWEIIKWWCQSTKSLPMNNQFIEMSKHYAHSNWQHHFIVNFFFSFTTVSTSKCNQTIFCNRRQWFKCLEIIVIVFIWCINLKDEKISAKRRRWQLSTSFPFQWFMNSSNCNYFEGETFYSHFTIFGHKYQPRNKIAVMIT